MGNAEWYSRAALGGIMVPAAISLGAIGLIIAGLWDFRGGAGFNATWEIAYGTLWVFVAVFLSSVGDSITSAAASIAGPGAAPDAVAAATGAAANGILDAFGLYLLIWAAVTFGFTIGTWFIAKPAFLAFGLTAIAFVLLGFANISEPGSSTADNLTTYGGWLGIIASAIVLYLAFALILNDHLGRQVMPIFPYTG
jgi:succinate-acetate transporter protein